MITRKPRSAADKPCAGELDRRPWMAAFIAALEQGGTARQAASAAGICHSTAYKARRRRPRFAAEWDAATPGRAHPRKPAVALPGPQARPSHWRLRFLEALAETSNVSASAQQAGVEPRVTYKARRSEPDFAARWNAALLEGYEHLEMEVLGHLRAPDPERKLDVAAALRLLAAHRETVLRLKALTEEEDEQATLDALDRWIDEMRERRTANQAILGEAEGNDGPE